MSYKSILSSIVGLIGGGITCLFGDITPEFTSLLVLVGLDIVTGLLVAGLFQNSKNSETGGLSSRTMVKGLCRKLGMLIMVAISYRLDLILGTNYVKSACIIALIVEETLSLVENLGLMGVPLPAVISNAIDVLKKQVNEKGEKKNG